MPARPFTSHARRRPVRGSLHTVLPYLLVTLALASACGGDGPEAGAGSVVFEGARIVTGEPGVVVQDGVFVVRDGRIVAAGTGGEVDVPAGATRVDLSGKTVIPALVNAPIHLELEREARAEQLRHMAYYGAGTVISMGHDEGAAAFELRDEPPADGARSLIAGRGITSPEPGRSEIPYWVESEDEARAAVRDLAGQEVDLVKIWVDDRGGQYEKLSEPLYRAIIDEAHTHGLEVAAHIFSLEDAKGLLRAGVDAFAHSIRDRDVDDELMTLWAERPAVTLIPNLPSPGVPADLSWIETVPEAQLIELQARETERPEAREAFGIQARNLERLHEAGMPVAFGTDGGTPWAVHLELEDMVRAGLTPHEAIVAATSGSAAFLDLQEVGAIAAGKSADFVVLDRDPLQDITATRSISDVYLRGSMIDREAIRARLLGGGA